MANREWLLSIGLTVGCLVVMPAAGCAKGGATMDLQSTAFHDGAPIPAKYARDGADVSPPLVWDKVPEQTREFALIVDDPDAPRKEPWVHWVIYKIPGDVRLLNEGRPNQPWLDAPAGALQGVNSWPSGKTTGYRGPAPPPGGAHHYRFHLYALDAPLELGPGASKDELLKAISGHVVGEARLIGTYHMGGARK